MKVNILYVAGMILIFCLIGTVSAAETFAKNQQFGLPENAVEVSPGVFYLGESMDKGEILEGYAFVHYAKGYEPATKSKSAFDDSVDIYKLMFGGIKWTSEMTYEVNTAGSNFFGSGDEKSILGDSLETWDIKTSFDLFNDELRTTTDTSVAGTEPDFINRIVWQDFGGPGGIAYNSFWFSTAMKVIVESDVVFNSNYTWADCTVAGLCIPDGVECNLNPTDCKMDLQSIATHEFGHNGLNDLYMPPSVELTMYGYGDYGETHARTLGTGDISGIQALYGE
jgi:hypothetical protein